MRDQDPELAREREGEEDNDGGVGGTEEREEYEGWEEQEEGEGARIKCWVEGCSEGESGCELVEGEGGKGWSRDVEFGEAGEGRLEIYLWEGGSVTEVGEEGGSFVGGGVEVRTAGVGGGCLGSFGVCEEGVAGGSHFVFVAVGFN